MCNFKTCIGAWVKSVWWIVEIGSKEILNFLQLTLYLYWFKGGNEATEEIPKVKTEGKYQVL